MLYTFRTLKGKTSESSINSFLIKRQPFKKSYYMYIHREGLCINVQITKVSYTGKYYVHIYKNYSEHSQMLTLAILDSYNLANKRPIQASAFLISLYLLLKSSFHLLVLKICNA